MVRGGKRWQVRQRDKKDTDTAQPGALLDRISKCLLFLFGFFVPSDLESGRFKHTLFIYHGLSPHSCAEKLVFF